jgi:hypothetical protein
MIALVALLAGCGSSTTTVTVPGPAATTSGTGTATSTPPAATAGTSTSPSPSQPPTSFVSDASFQSPSGNIGCMIISGTARCDIVHHAFALPPRPASCPHIVDFGQGLIVEGSAPAHIVCAGDTARDPAAPKLPYGTASRVEEFTCVSRTEGVTCTSRVSGHGFFLSIQRYLLF